MSNIPRARALLNEVEYATNLNAARRLTRMALSLMLRETPIRRAAAKPSGLTPEIKAKIRSLTRSRYTMHEIANITGVRNMARISEVMNGKR